MKPTNRIQNNVLTNVIHISSLNPFRLDQSLTFSGSTRGTSWESNNCQSCNLARGPCETLRDKVESKESNGASAEYVALFISVSLTKAICSNTSGFTPCHILYYSFGRDIRDSNCSFRHALRIHIPTPN